MRPVWDPNEKYRLYNFVRQSQTFPDVLLQRVTESTEEDTDAVNDREVLLGVELKGWYLLAKEGEPSFRYKVTPDACARQDLIAVVPWVLENVISGAPAIFTPYVESARYAAKYRNYYWQVLRNTSQATTIHAPNDVSPYPDKTDKIQDHPEKDSGSNFGRFARTRIMDDYLDRAKNRELCGISAEHWLSFFGIFREQTEDEHIAEQIERLRAKIDRLRTQDRSKKADAAERILSGLSDLLSG